eukprot:4249599-Heterocapsa_arctica.AAC.1
MPPQGGLPTAGGVEPDALCRRDHDPTTSPGGQLPVHCGRQERVFREPAPHGQSSKDVHREPSRSIISERRGRLPYRGVGLAAGPKLLHS